MECSYCNDNVSMPFTCSLCSQKHCSKHRLPETHKCTNISLFNTDTYRKQKLAKARLPRKVIAVNESFGMDSRMGNMGLWSSGSLYQDLIIGGILLSITAFLRPLLFDQNVEWVFGAMIYGVIGMILIFEIRQLVARSYDIETEFNIYPAGAVISVLLAIIPIRFLVFGFFRNSNVSSIKSEAIVGLTTVYASLSLYFIADYLIVPYLGLSFLTVGIYGAGRVFFIFGFYLMIPWGLWEGRTIWNWNNGVYLINLAAIFVVAILFVWN